MIVVLDTNIVLDAIAAREPFREAAERIFLLAAEGKFQACISANSVTDIYYIARKTLSGTDARESIRRLIDLFAVISLESRDLEKALDMPMDDFEDAVVVALAQKMRAQYIITRDVEFLACDCGAQTVSPVAFLAETDSA